MNCIILLYNIVLILNIVKGNILFHKRTYRIGISRIFFGRMAMGYYIDLSNVSLNAFKNKLKSSRLLPSQMILLEDIDRKFETFEAHGIRNMYELQQVLKNKDKINVFSKLTSLPVDYLTVLRREVNSYHPQARKLKDFTVLSSKTKKMLEEMGIKTTLQLYDKVASKTDRNNLKNEWGVDDLELLILAKLCDVSRLRYVNPAFATLLVNSNYDTVEKIKNADFNEVYEDLILVNGNKKFYKGRINLKDMEFLINDINHFQFTVSLDVEY